MEEWFTLKNAIIGIVALVVLGRIIDKVKSLKAGDKIEEQKKMARRSRKFRSEE